jgi:hypothetical protein
LRGTKKPYFWVIGKRIISGLLIFYLARRKFGCHAPVMHPTRALTRTLTFDGDQFQRFDLKGIPYGKWRIRADVTFPDGRQFWYPLKLSTSPYDAKGTEVLEFSTLPPQSNISCLGHYGGSDLRIEMTVN